MKHPMKLVQNTCAAACLALVACGGATKEDKCLAIDALITEARSRVGAMEDSLSDAASFDRRRLMALRDVYVAYADRFPQDSLAPDMLRKAAATSGDLNEHEKAVGLYDRLIENYPQWPRTADAMYFRAFEIENGLGKKGEAKAAYEDFMKKYPENQFADDAAKMIEYMSLTDAELIERFQKMNEGTEEGSAGQ